MGDASCVAPVLNGFVVGNEYVTDPDDCECSSLASSISIGSAVVPPGRVLEGGSGDVDRNSGRVKCEPGDRGWLVLVNRTGLGATAGETSRLEA
jgi:hypothetical protein